MQDGHHGATYELVGTKPLSQSEVAAAIGAALGRDVRAEAEPLAAWDARARAGEMGEHERATLAAMFRYYADHGLVGNPNTLRWLLGRAPNDLAAFSRACARSRKADRPTSRTISYGSASSAAAVASNASAEAANDQCTPIKLPSSPTETPLNARRP